MEIYHINTHTDNHNYPDSICAIGFFDGMHIGHQSLVNEVNLLSEKRHLKRSLMCFDQHPKEVIHHISYPHLMSLKDRENVLEKKIDILFIIEFDEEMMKLSPESFVDLLKKVHIQHVVVGEDFHFGYKNLGDTSLLSKHINTTVMKEVTYLDHKVSSTYIKSLLDEGDMETVYTLLKNYYQLTGEVIHGKQRGRRMGFPTVNIDYDHYYLPKNGVYSVIVDIENKSYQGMANIGYNPTFHDIHKKSLEIHIFDFDEEIYDTSLTVHFINFIRDEKTFDSVEELIEQLSQDKKRIEKELTNTFNTL